MNKPTLLRTVEYRVIAGVVGGIARRFGWNPTVLRIVYVVASVLSAAFPGILVYLALWLLMAEGDWMPLGWRPLLRGWPRCASWECCRRRPTPCWACCWGLPEFPWERGCGWTVAGWRWCSAAGRGG